MIEYDADLVSDSLLTRTVFRKRLERCERKMGRGEEGREMKRRTDDLDTVMCIQWCSVLKVDISGK